MCAFFVGGNMKNYMLEALKEANKAFSAGEVPIGCVIVKNNKIISRGHNKKESTHLATSHAEMIAINKACKKLKNWRLLDCTLYVTVEPCLMCCGAIIQTRIKKIVYGIDNENYGGIEYIKNNEIEIEKNIMAEECKNIIKKFFEEKRK